MSERKFSDEDKKFLARDFEIMYAEHAKEMYGKKPNQLTLEESKIILNRILSDYSGFSSMSPKNDDFRHVFQQTFHKELEVLLSAGLVKPKIEEKKVPKDVATV